MNYEDSDMIRDRAIKAYLIYRRLTGAPANSNTARKFYKFLGSNGPDQNLTTLWNEVQKTKTAKQRIDWMLGPNAAVLFEVWKAQNE